MKTEKELVANPKMMKEVVEEEYPGITYDSALPHDWVKQMRENGFDPVGRVVWLYPKEAPYFGMPGPVTVEAMRELFTAYYNVGYAEGKK